MRIVERDGCSNALRLYRLDFTIECTAYGSRLALRLAGTTVECLLRRLLRHRRLSTRHRGAAHVARLRLVVAAHAMHGLAVVPHHEVMQRPFVDVDELRLRGVLGEVAQQYARFRDAHASDGAGMRGQIQRLAAV